MAFDPNDSKNEALVRRLRDEEVGWLVTVHKGTPRPVPVWFLWDGDRSLLVYSSPKALKTRAVADHPEASFHLNSSEHGGNIVILYGRVQQDDSVPRMLDNAAYVTKYREAIEAYKAEANTTEQAINDEFTAPLLMTIEDARAW